MTKRFLWGNNDVFGSFHSLSVCTKINDESLLVCLNIGAATACCIQQQIIKISLDVKVSCCFIQYINFLSVRTRSLITISGNGALWIVRKYQGIHACVLQVCLLLVCDWAILEISYKWRKNRNHCCVNLSVSVRIVQFDNYFHILYKWEF